MSPNDRRFDVTRPSLLLGLFAVVTILDLIAVAMGLTVLEWIAKPLLAPLLIAFLLRAGVRDLVPVALLFAFAGDVALLGSGQVMFLIGMLFFFGNQLCLIVAFRRRSRPRWPTILIGGLLWLAVNALLWGQLGDLRIPMLVYSLALIAMACAATGNGYRVATGGVLFLASDLLIGFGKAGLRVPAHDILVMATYAAALAFIAVGWARAVTRRHGLPPGLPAT